CVPPCHVGAATGPYRRLPAMVNRVGIAAAPSGWVGWPRPATDARGCPVSAKRTIPWFAAFVAAALATPAGDDATRHELSAPSRAVIEIGPDGTVIMHATNVRLVPYALFDGEHQLPRLATVTSDVRQRTDAEGDDPASTVAVTVDDLSAAT